MSDTKMQAPTAEKEKVQEEETRRPSDAGEGRREAAAAAAADADSLTPSQQVVSPASSSSSQSSATLEDLPRLFSTLTDAQWEQVKAQEQRRRDSLKQKKAAAAAPAAAAAAPQEAAVDEHDNKNNDDKQSQAEKKFLLRIQSIQGRIKSVKAILEGATLPPTDDKTTGTAGKANANDKKQGEEEDFASNLDEGTDEEDQHDKKMAAKSTNINNDDDGDKKPAAKDYQHNSQEDENRQARAAKTNDGTTTATSTSTSNSSNKNKKKRPPPPPSFTSECEESNKKPKKAAPQDTLEPDSDGGATAAEEEEEDGTAALTLSSSPLPPSSRRSSRQRSTMVLYNATPGIMDADTNKWVSRRRPGKPKTNKKVPPPGSSSKTKKTPARASKSPKGQPPPTAPWQKMFQELKRFKKLYGHVEVSQSKPHMALALWCKSQRRSFSNRQEMATTGEKKFPKTIMTEYQHSQLESLGFRFVAATSLSFEQRVDQLSKYKSTHGDCRVPQSYSGYHNLGIWVHHKRTQYRRGKLPADHVSMLESLGFEWTVPTRGASATQKKKNAATKSTRRK